MEYENDYLLRLMDEWNVSSFSRTRTEQNSGRKTHFYVDWRDAISDAYTCQEIAGELIAFTNHLGLSPDKFVGVPEGASLLGAFASYFWGIGKSGWSSGSQSLVMGRGRKKSHGTDSAKNYIGNIKGEVIVVEDSISTGLSGLEFIADLREDDDVDILAFIALTNREEKSPISGIDFDSPSLIRRYSLAFDRATGRDFGDYDKAGLSVEEVFDMADVKLYSLTTATEIFERKFPMEHARDVQLVRALQKEREKFGVTPFVLGDAFE